MNNCIRALGIVLCTAASEGLVPSVSLYLLMFPYSDLSERVVVYMFYLFYSSCSLNLNLKFCSHALCPIYYDLT